MSGQLGDLSDKQAALLEKFRENVRDALKPDQVDDDYYLLRWLRARSFDIKKSESMLRNNVTWRKKNRVDFILEEFDYPEVLTKYFPGGYMNFDKEGALIWFDPHGNIDLRGLLRSCKKADMVKGKVYMLEKMNHVFREQYRKTGKRVDRITIVFDMEKIGLRHLWRPGLDVMKEILVMYEDQYPELLQMTLVINAPRIFPIIFNIARPFLSADTMSKIKVVGSNYKEVIQKYMDADQIPVYWGGTCTDPDGDPRCVSKICFGGTIPESYYVQQSESDENFTDTNVGRGSSLQLDYDIVKPMSVLRWQFSTHDYDIGFGIFRRTTDSRQKAGEMEEVLANARVNSHMVPEDGAFTVTEPGTYVIRFDNTFSWARSKVISYLIEVLPPDESEISVSHIAGISPESPSTNSKDSKHDEMATKINTAAEHSASITEQR